MSTNQQSQEEVHWNNGEISLSLNSSPHTPSPSYGSDTNGPSTVNHYYCRGTTYVIGNVEKLVFNYSGKAASSTGIEDHGPEECQDHYSERHSNLNANTSATKRNAKHQNAISAEAFPSKIFKPSYQTLTTVTTMEVNPEQDNEASGSSKCQPENVTWRDTGIYRDHCLLKNKKKKCSPSTLKEFITYAETAGIRPYRKSLKPHIIMKNIETFVYKNEKENAILELKLLYERMKYQSHPTSDKFRDLAEVASCRRSPVAACLLLAATVFKKTREDPHKISFEVSVPFQKAYNLVSGLTEDDEHAENVLNRDLMSNGTHPNDIANFVVEVMGDMYEWASSCTRGVSSDKAFALQWIIAGLHKAGKYNHAIKLAQARKGDYQGKKNEAVVHIYRNVGLCLDACENFVGALFALREARAMAQVVVGSDWCKTLLSCLKKDIVMVKKKLKTAKYA